MANANSPRIPSASRAAPDIEPLEAGAWRASFARLYAWLRQPGLSALPAEAVAVRLRKAYHLLLLAPVPLRPLIVPAVREGEFEALLAASPDEAALALLADALRPEVTQACRTSDAGIVLQVRCQSAPVAGRGDTLPLAVLAALSELALALVAGASPARPGAKAG